MTYFEELDERLTRMVTANPRLLKNDEDDPYGDYGPLVNSGTGRQGDYLVVRFPGQSMRVFCYKDGVFIIDHCSDERGNGIVNEKAGHALFDLWFEMMW